ncbi:class I SAM-dependent methyltransferase [Allokutzneria multivorans]|uniref:Class I SAM-dependent methyltransferase n=1 Tax=Allokutzneria multivorans TaxID=1142134 RepID=A0ABP7TC30_9PSEU
MSTVVEALEAWRNGDRDTARALASAAGTRLGDELASYWKSEADGRVYDQPAAFRAFVRGGGNVELYSRLSQALADSYSAHQPSSLLDIGCGDGLAVAPAVASHAFDRIDLVEPSAALLDLARQNVPSAHTWNTTAQEFTLDLSQRWSAAQATFSLHALEPSERLSVLRRLRPHVDRLVIAEFDVPVGSDDLAWLVSRYELGVAEYHDSLVAQGFLLPVLLGQIVPGAVRSTWEQPISAWRGQLLDAGFAQVDVMPLMSYWWSPAMLITAY